MSSSSPTADVNVSPAIRALLAGSLRCGDQELPGSVLEGKMIGFYFSAHWCAPCRNFTPQLVAAYHATREASLNDSQFEVVFVSGDRSEEQFDDYRRTMPWPAVAYEDDADELREQLKELFCVKGFPTLVVYNARTHQIVTQQGRQAIDMQKEEAIQNWISRLE